MFDPRTAKVLATICAFVAIAALLVGVRHTLVVILFAVLFAYLLEPLVFRIQNSPLARQSRPLAILGTYLAIAIAVGLLILLFGPRVAADAQHFTQSLPGLLEKVTTGKIVWQFGSRHGWSYDTQLKIEQFIAEHQDTILAWTGQVGTAVAKSLQNLMWVVLVPILAIFFLRDGRQFAESFLHIFDENGRRRFWRGVFHDLDEMLAYFIRAQMVLAAISLVAYSTVLTLMHFPYALVLGLAAGVMEFIPVVGPLAAAVAIVGVGFLTAYRHLLAIVLFLAIWRVVQDYFTVPRVMGSRLRLHPLAAIVAVLMGGELGGVLGVYLSIPAAAAMRIVWLRWQKYAAANTATPPKSAAAGGKLRTGTANVKG